MRALTYYQGSLAVNDMLAKSYLLLPKLLPLHGLYFDTVNLVLIGDEKRRLGFEPEAVQGVFHI